MRSAIHWASMVKRWQESGQSAEVFARCHNCTPEALTWWNAEFENEAALERTGGGNIEFVRVVAQSVDGGEKKPSHSAKQAEVTALSRPSAEPFDQGSGESLVVELGSVRILVQRGFDQLLLKQVVEALGGC